MATIKSSAFKLALIQLGGTGKDKTVNLALARAKVLEASKGKSGKEKVDLVVLPVRTLFSILGGERSERREGGRIRDLTS